MRKVIVIRYQGYNTNNNKKKVIIGVIIVGAIIITGFTTLMPDKKNMLTHSELITDENRILIGKETIVEYSNATDFSQDEILKETQTNIPINQIIKQMYDEKFIPSSIDEFKTTEKNGVFITPEIITINGSVSVLTNANGGGWDLKVGDKIEYVFEKYKSIIENQNLIIGYIKDGVQIQGEKFDQLKGAYHLAIEESGQYHVYLLNASSDPLSLKNGTLTISKYN